MATVTELDQARGDTVGEISSAILLASGKVLTNHGNDPVSPAILAAGFVMAINTIGRKIDPNIKSIIVKMLNKDT